MNAKNTGGPALPCDAHNTEDEPIPGLEGDTIPPHSVAQYSGMHLRDYFAAKAMVMKFGPTGNTSELRVHAENCYEMADAMLEARKS